MTTCNQIAHPSLGYVLEHIGLGGGIAIAAIAAAAGAAAYSFFKHVFG